MGAVQKQVRFDFVPVGTPAWWVPIAPNTWTPIAQGSGGAAFQNGKRLVDVASNPLPTAVFGGGNSFAGHVSALLDSWCGAWGHPTRLEYGIGPNGGHADGADNSQYRLALTSAVPGWSKLTEATPNSVLSDSTQFATTLPYFKDGFPRAQHSVGFPAYGDGRVWYAECNSVTDPAGGGADQIVSFWREDPVLIAADQAGTPLSYATMTGYGNTGPTGGKIGPWNFHGPSNVGGQNWPFGYAVFDPVSHRVYGVSNYSTSALQIWSFATQGANMGVSSGISNANGAGASPPRPSWLVCAPDLRLIIFGSNGSFFPGTIWVYDISQEAANGGVNRAPFTQISPAKITGDLGPQGTPGWYGEQVGTGLAFPSSSGACYIQANHTIAVHEPRTLANSFWRLQIPTSGGVYNPAGTWAWTKIVPSTGATDVAQWVNMEPSPSPNNGCFGKLQSFQFPDGTYGIVFAGRYDGATWIYKVPATGL